MISITLFLSICGIAYKSKTQKEAELVLFCAAGMKVPITEIANRFQEETGIPVRLHFAGSGTLLSNLRIAPGDLYLAADASYIKEAERYDLIAVSYTHLTLPTTPYV